MMNRATEIRLTNGTETFMLGNIIEDDTGTHGSYTKPTSVPYLNVFCDPIAFTCNDPATLERGLGIEPSPETQALYESLVAAPAGALEAPAAPRVPEGRAA